MKKRKFDLAVTTIFRPISIVLRTRLLSHDLNTFWCVRLSSRDAKSVLNVATFLKMALQTKNRKVVMKCIWATLSVRMLLIGPFFTESQIEIIFQCCRPVPFPVPVFQVNPNITHNFHTLVTCRELCCLDFAVSSIKISAFL